MHHVRRPVISRDQCSHMAVEPRKKTFSHYLVKNLLGIPLSVVNNYKRMEKRRKEMIQRFEKYKTLFAIREKRVRNQS